MRYTNWDVLLFPEGSKTPLQEFKTSCYVTDDPDSCQRKRITPDELLAPAPTLTCFIPNLTQGHPFRISLHSWEPPVATRTTNAMALTHNCVVYFEARVLVDGLCVAQTSLNQQSSWPQIIDTLSYPGVAENFEPLRFPRFRKEVLTQSWWNAGETIGRIKVIIAEGLGRSLVPFQFERTKNVVSFSFQHAPIHILKESKIAWPNPGMWVQVPQQLYSLSVPLDHEPIDPNAHGHSPRGKSNDINGALTRPDRAHELMSHAPYPTPGIKADFEDSFLPAMTLFQDPFVDDDNSGIHGTTNGRECSEDQYMPDHSRSITPASKNQFDELVATLSSRKDITGGLLAPANTRVGSAANTPSGQRLSSIGAEWRVFGSSHGILHSASVTTRDVSPEASQEPSGVEMASGISEPWLDMIEQPGLRVQMSPTKEVKGRKEGMSRNLEHPFGREKGFLAPDLFRRSGKENKPGSAENPFVVSEGKRKRSGTVLDSLSPIHQEGNGSSPTRKVIRTGWERELPRYALGDM